MVNRQKHTKVSFILCHTLRISIRLFLSGFSIFPYRIPHFRPLPDAAGIAKAVFIRHGLPITIIRKSGIIRHQVRPQGGNQTLE
jgi:hypothetical protein